MSLSVRRENRIESHQRDAAADYARSIDEAIAVYTQQGLQPTEHLVKLRAEIDAAKLENKDDDTPLEMAVPDPSVTARRRRHDG